NLPISHAPANAENCSRRCLGVGTANLRDLFAAHDNFERCFAGEKSGSILRSEVRNQISETIDLQNYSAETVVARRFWLGRGKAHVILNLFAKLVRVHHLCQIGG